MKIIIAEHSGFCFGVKRAINFSSELAAAKGKVYSLGPLIHNEREIARFGDSIKVIRSLSEVDKAVSDSVIIRTHGVGPLVLKEAVDLGLNVSDLTCPFVKKAQKTAADLMSGGLQVVIVGDKNHPEVLGIKAWTDDTAIIISCAEEVEAMPENLRVGVLAQTTQQKKIFESVVRALREKYSEVVVKNTICDATTKRQNAAAEVAAEVDTMVIVGGRNSANTKKLEQICRNQGISTQLVEGAEDLNPALFGGVSTAGVCAGASTPEWIIEEVVNNMVEMEKMGEEVVNKAKEAKVAEAAEEAKVEEVVAENGEEEAEESFGAILEREEARKDIRRGSRIKGVVVQVKNDEILVDIGGKSEGLLQSNQLMPEEAADIPAHFAVGDEIEVIVLKKENKEGYPILSKKMVDQVLVWEKLAVAKEEGTPVSGKVVEVVKGGLLVDVGLRGFVPASLVDIRFVDDLKAYVGKEITAKVLECDRSHNKLLLSIKAVLLEELQAKKETLMAEIEEGQTRHGVVSRLTNFGAFIDLGGVDGLLHVSEMAWFRVNHPSDILKEGDEIEVYVLGVDKENQKISLGLKQLIPNPWTLVEEKYPVGAVVDATVMRTAPFGAFLQLEPGVEGLVHISQLAYERVAKTEDVVNPGDEVEVKVLDIDVENKRISLSIKETLPEPVKEEVVEEAPVEEAVAEEEVETHEEELGATLGDIFPDDLKSE
ncbi:MAG: bifunctional 4-hydroxy-3-methylbut-2-enyl diphosphate reductase/30S ribosomal protein S1 [Bacillota bacterium]